jgi:hypothetical protein
VAYVLDGFLPSEFICSSGLTTIGTVLQFLLLAATLPIWTILTGLKLLREKRLDEHAALQEHIALQEHTALEEI